ncbi:hypothetical protein ACFWNN_01285 [Lentzea sp. NPDC058450]|uniref:hypothetical protein n=1 Tax=Lentzea sp. NPDC058450 TaxID=3346505 RepID=UPI003659DBEA
MSIAAAKDEHHAMALRRAWVLPPAPPPSSWSHLCEGARSLPLRTDIGFSHTFVLTAVTLLLTVLSARLVD